MRLVARARAAPTGFDFTGDEAPLVLNVVHELVAEMLEEALHRQRRSIAERADGASGDVVGDVVEKREVFHAPLAVLDAVHHAIEPARALAARGALAAGLLEIEVRQALERTHHARAIVHDDDRPGAEHRAGLGD